MARLITRPGKVFDFGDVAESYENWYDTSAGREHDLTQQRDVYELLGPVSHGHRLLDVGCGTGHWSRYFQSLGYQVHGVDISEKMIRVARKLTSECKFEVANACALPYKDACFDIVASMATLEFTRAPLIALREMVRCLKPGGRLLIGTLNRLATLNRDRIANGDEPYASACLFSSAELHYLLSFWGKARMRASLPSPQQADCNNNQPGMAGPFIVAVMQR